LHPRPWCQARGGQAEGRGQGRRLTTTVARKPKHEEHVNHERWLVSYADFITLLFAFFVILYALSEVDKRKLKTFSKSRQFAFAHGGTGGRMPQGKNPDTFKPKLVGQQWPMGRRDSDPGPFESMRSI